MSLFTCENFKLINGHEDMGEKKNYFEVERKWSHRRNIGHSQYNYI